MTIISSRGYKFNVESDGFVKYNAETDRDAGIEAIQAALDETSLPELSEMHILGKRWQAGDCDGERPNGFDRIESIGHAAATNGWHNPNAVFFSVSAA
jgi:hypothetical protein